MHLRSVFFVTAILALAVAVPAQAAIILELGPVTNLDGGLISRNVIARGTAGETIAGFDAINLSNAHQVWGLGNVQTLRAGSDPGFGWNVAWAEYDSRLLNPAADVLASVGAALAETNDLTTTGTLGLPQEFGQNAPSGFGTLKSSDGSDGYRLLPEVQANQVEFLKVVTTPTTAHLNVVVGFFEMGGTAGMITDLLGIDIGGEGGGDTVPPLITPIIANVDLNNPASLAAVTNRQLMGMDETTAVADLVWSNLVYDSGPGKNNPAATDAMMDGDGVFNWNPSGWRMGAHLFNATLADEAGNTTTGLAITVNLIVPEPATFALCGLALVGLVGFTRRRG